MKESDFRREYQKEYYRQNKERIKQNYNAQKQYLRYVEVKAVLNRLKKQIGSVNYDLIMAEINNLERHKYG